jgi:uncharacterized protein YqiB (DUF1249 family)
MIHNNIAEDRVRLADLHGTCELNYLRLTRLCPDLRVVQRRELFAGSRRQFGLSIEVTERSAFTTMVRLNLRMENMLWAGLQNLVLRVYHDASMLEVAFCDDKRIGSIRYRYPNAAMYMPDEKVQLNEFLGIWLDYFLAHGSRTDNPKLVNPEKGSGQ